MAVSSSAVMAVITKTLNWLRLGMVPTGTIITGLYTEPPEGYLAFKKTSQIMKSDYPALCEILFKLDAFKGDGSTYASIPDVDHRVIEMCSNVSEVGTLIEAGLPDISGCMNTVDGGWGEGAFKSTDAASAFDPSRDVYAKQDIDFKASRSNALYGKASTVQMSSLRLLAIVKF